MPAPNSSKFPSNKSGKNIGLRLWGYCHVWKHLSHEISHRFRLSKHKIVQISQEWPKFLLPPSTGAPACGFRGWSSSASQGDHPLLRKGWVARGFLSWSLPSSDWKMRWSNGDGKRWWLLWNRSGPVGFRKSKIAHYRSGLPHPHGPRRNHLQLPPASGARRPRWSPLGASCRPADCQADHQYQPDAVETVGDGCDIWWFLTHLQPVSKAKSWKASRA